MINKQWALLSDTGGNTIGYSPGFG